MTTHATALEDSRQVLWITERLAASTADPGDARVYHLAARKIVSLTPRGDRPELCRPPTTVPDVDATRVMRWFAARVGPSEVTRQLAARLVDYVAARRSIGTERQPALFGAM